MYPAGFEQMTHLFAEDPNLFWGMLGFFSVVGPVVLIAVYILWRYTLRNGFPHLLPNHTPPQPPQPAPMGVEIPDEFSVLDEQDVEAYNLLHDIRAGWEAKEVRLPLDLWMRLDQITAEDDA